MQLTTTQEDLIRAFLKESGVTVQHLPSAARDQVLAQLRQGIRKEIQAAFREGDLSEDRLRGIFSRLQVSSNGWQEPREPAVEQVRQRTRREPPKVEVEEDADIVLLGVCDYWAERWGLYTHHVRIFFCMMGALTGPVAILVYLGGYAEWRNRKRRGGVKWMEALRPFGITSLVCAFIFAGGKLSLAMMQWVYAGFYQKTLLLSEWGALESGQGVMVMGAILMLGPLAALGGLPVEAEWKNRIQVGVRVGLYGYGLLVAIHIAYALTGFLLRVADRLAV
ncbi:MAG: hypothetical protein COA73_15245 [Candidatus Hydrogenedentota bacterium]|nr:MAG: hypothetical protein COA73_15245 [Candidatus Hydrogenedentota bacterium]